LQAEYHKNEISMSKEKFHARTARGIPRKLVQRMATYLNKGIHKATMKDLGFKKMEA